MAIVTYDFPRGGTRLDARHSRNKRNCNPSSHARYSVSRWKKASILLSSTFQETERKEKENRRMPHLLRCFRK